MSDLNFKLKSKTGSIVYLYSDPIIIEKWNNYRVCAKLHDMRGK